MGRVWWGPEWRPPVSGRSDPHRDGSFAVVSSAARPGWRRPVSPGRAGAGSRSRLGPTWGWPCTRGSLRAAPGAAPLPPRWEERLRVKWTSACLVPAARAWGLRRGPSLPRCRAVERGACRQLSVAPGGGARACWGAASRRRHVTGDRAGAGPVEPPVLSRSRRLQAALTQVGACCRPCLVRPEPRPPAGRQPGRPRARPGHADQECTRRRAQR